MHVICLNQFLFNLCSNSILTEQTQHDVTQLGILVYTGFIIHTILSLMKGQYLNTAHSVYTIAIHSFICLIANRLFLSI